MPEPASNCPPDHLLERFCAAACSPDEASSIALHAEFCGRCRAWVAEARADDALLGQLRGAVEDGAVRLAAGSSATAPPKAGSGLAAGAATNGPSLPYVPDIAGYRILGILGEGGMGVVYEAEQERPRRRVALKLIRPGAATANALRRFEHEAHVLGRLQHPGIAQIYGVATTQTPVGLQPYFAMELVEGENLTAFAADHCLDVRQRLELFERVCQAVQHAHDKGVVHRDLKPSNILVTAAGQPKILDFGVARVTDADIAATTILTDPGMLVGTLQYMSPEQCGGESGDIEVQSDVYSLGVIGYELLAGRPPHPLSGKMLVEACRIIREDEPKSLGSFDRALRGDLETIFAKALDKEKLRRYHSAGELAADIRRYLNHQPIQARPATLRYQFGKLVMRHKGFAGMALALLVALVGFAVGMMLLYLRADDQRRRAEKAERDAQAQAETAYQVSASLVDLINKLDPYRANADGERLDETLSPLQVLDRAAESVVQQLADQPLAQAKVLQVLAGTYLNRGAYVRAEELARKALQLHGALLGAEHLETARTVQRLAAIHSTRGDYREATALHQQALEILRKELGEDAPETWSSMVSLGGVLAGSGDYESAESLVRDVLQRAQVHGDERHAANCLMQLAGIASERKEYSAAQEFYEQAIEIYDRLLGRDSDHADQARVNLADVLRCVGDLGNAETLLRDVLERQRSRLGVDSIQIAPALRVLANVQWHRGDRIAALATLREALDIRRRALGREHPEVAEIWLALAEFQRYANDLAESETSLHAAEAIYRNAAAEGHPNLCGCLIQLGHLASGRRDHAAAAAYYHEAWNIARRLFTPNHPHIQTAARHLAAMMIAQGDRTRAYAVCREFAGGDQAAGEPHFAFALTRAGLGWQRAGEFAAAEAALREAWEIQARSLGADVSDTLDTQYFLGSLLFYQGNYAEALEVYQQIQLIIQDGSVKHHNFALNVQNNVALMLGMLGRYDETYPLFEATLEAKRELLGDSSLSIAHTLYDWASVLHAQGDLAAAEARCTESLTIIQQSGYSRSGHSPAATLLLLANIRLDADDPAGAEEYARQAIDAYGFDHPEAVFRIPLAESLLGATLVRQERFEEAEPLLVQGYPTILRVFGADDWRTRAASERIESLYDAWGKPELADQWRQQQLDEHPACVTAEWSEL